MNSSQAPPSVEETQEMIRRAAERMRTIVLIGNGTKSRESVSPSPQSSALSTCRLSRLIDLSPGDMTVTVEAGMTLRQLDAHLRPHNLRLPLDPPDYDGRATIGGVLATNDCGPLRLMHGTARDHVIGMSMVLADGTLIKAGGRVVKNVAGYDLHRLFVGSFGTLGLIASVSFKLKPRAESLRLVTLRPDSTETAERWTAELLSGATRPALLDWLRTDGALTVVVGFEDQREAVDWQVQQVVRGFAGAEPHSHDESPGLYERLRARAIDQNAGIVLRAAMPSSAMQLTFALVPPEFSMHAHAASGVLHASCAEDTHAALADFTRFVLDAGGFVRIRMTGQPERLHRNDDPVVLDLERRLKSRLDANGVFPSR